MIITGKKIIQWSPPRSGSTLVWQILDHLFEDPNYTKYKWTHPNIVQKTHTLDYSLLNNNSCFFFTTLRNPIDCMVSFMIVYKHAFTKDNLDKNIASYLNYFSLMKLVESSNNSVILRYDEFYEDNNVIYNAIERAFEIHIDSKLRNEMNEKFSKKNNKKIAESMKDFSEVKQDSFIHGDHFNSTKISYWKEKIPEEFHNYVEQRFVTILNYFNFRKDWVDLYKKGIELYQNKKTEEAIQYIEKSVNLRAAPVNLKDLGTIYKDFANSKSKIEDKKPLLQKCVYYYQQVLNIKNITPELKVGILSALSGIYSTMKNGRKCADILFELAELTNNSIHYSKAGYFYLLTEQMEKSLNAYSRSIYLSEWNYFAHNNIAQIFCHLGAHHMIFHHREEAIRIITEILKGNVPKQIEGNDVNYEAHIIHSNLLLDMNYCSDVFSYDDIYKRHLEYGEKFEKPLKHLHKRPKYNNEKIHIGYLGNDFRSHAVGTFFDPFFKEFNQDKFEIYVYSNTDSPKDELQNKFKTYNINWNDISEIKDDKKIVELVRKQKIDIMVEVTGHTGVNRLNLMCYRLAPIQVSYLAYPNTTGIDCIDYKFSDKHLVPKKMRKYFTEELYDLPYGIHCYTPNEDHFKIARKPGKNIRFGCFNNPAKFGAQCIKTFCEIMKKVPNSTLYIRYNKCNSNIIKGAIHSKFKYHGIPPNRIDIAYSNTKKEYIQMYNQIDVVLDPFPYTGHTVNCEALWMGVPFVTMEGKTYHERVGTSMLKHLKLYELIAQNTEEYVEKIVELANDKKKRIEYNLNIRKKIKEHPMSDHKKFVKSIEDAYEDIYQRFMNESE